MPVDLPPSAWQMPDPEEADDNDLVGVGADLDAGTILAAYRAGIFPMPVEGQLAWWSPDPRAILPLDGLKVSRSLRKACARFEVRLDTAFDDVIRACAEPSRRGGWISPPIIDAYVTLHRMGWAHSVEAWTRDGRLAGGLYGIAFGGVFAGESMFHRETDASKVALVALIELLAAGGAVLLDVQWQTDHLKSLGVIEIPRSEYLSRLAAARDLPLPAAFQ